MGLYDVVMGDGKQGERGAVLLGVLANPVVARFRDAWVEKGDDGEPVIAIYTRQGGGNRECYCDTANCVPVPSQHVPANCYAACNEALAAHPAYLRDADDDFDGTYATFYFRVPEAAGPEVRAALASIAGDRVNMSERWQQAIERVGSGDLRPAETALADQLAAFLSDESPGAPKVMEV